MEKIETIVIGGGACGLMCAVQAGFLGKKVVILERNSESGAKILISGGGRCNYTNLFTSYQNFISENPHFCKSALSQWTVSDTISFFEAYGIAGKEKTLGQLFPVTDKARDVVKIFTRLCNDLGQEIRCNAEVISLKRGHNDFIITYSVNGVVHECYASKVVMASGGLPVQKMGASDFALKTARQMGMQVTETAPALVPLTITGKDSAWFAQLSGNSVFSRVYNDRISFEENILFTHWGLSGPAVLQISSYWRPGETITIDLLPSQSIRQIIDSERSLNGKKQLVTILAGLFTRKFAEAATLVLPVQKNLAALTKAETDVIESFIHSFQVKPAGTKGYDRAEVMRGGVSTNDLSSKTLESKTIPGLFFGGECVDVTGWLGGYNFQWAWASGFVIAQNI